MISDSILENQRRLALVVDDNLDHRRLIARWLELSGFRTVQAANGSQAYKECQQTTFAIIVSDVQMPDGTGLQLLDWLRNMPKPTPPVILMTGQEDFDHLDAVQRGAVCVLQKPVQWHLLNNAVLQIV